MTMLQRTPTWMAVKPSRDWFANAARRVLPRKWAYWLARQRSIRLFDWLYKVARRNPAKAGEHLSGAIAKELGFRIAYTQWGILIALIFVGLPFVTRTVQPVIEEFRGKGIVKYSRTRKVICT